MTQKTAERRIAEFIVSQLAPHVDVETLTPDRKLLEGNVIQSLQLLRLVMFLETTFGTRIPARDMRVENFESLDAIVNLLRQNGADL